MAVVYIPAAQSVSRRRKQRGRHLQLQHTTKLPIYASYCGKKYTTKYFLDSKTSSEGLIKLAFNMTIMCHAVLLSGWACRICSGGIHLLLISVALDNAPGAPFLAHSPSFLLKHSPCFSHLIINSMIYS